MVILLVELLGDDHRAVELNDYEARQLASALTTAARRIETRRDGYAPAGGGSGDGGGDGPG